VLTCLATIAGVIWQGWYEKSQKRENESKRDSAILDNLKKGPVFEELIDHIIPRKPLIVGEHGTGKTSLIKLAINGINEPKGIVYVDIPLRCDLEVNVTQAMQEALGWNPEYSSESPSLEEVLKVFTKLAIKYKHEYNRVPVLIIDNANRLAQKQQELLNLFQDYAKLATDNERVSVVFVSSEGRIPHQMMLRSSWSRHGRIIEIGDVSKEEAMQYLKLRNIDKKQAEQIYELVGGRMIHLKIICDNIEGVSTLKAIRQMMFLDAESALESTGINPGRPYHKDGAVIIRELLKKGSISKHTYYDLVNADTADKLLEGNVFAMQVNSKEVNFQSTVIKRYCEENSALWS